MSPTKIAVPLAAETLATLAEQVEAAVAQGAELLELRLDALRSLDAATVREAVRRTAARTSLPRIATCRDPREGGAKDHPAAGRAEALVAAVEAGVDYVDLELENTADGPLWPALRQALGTHGRTRLILSSHDFTGPFADPAARFARSRAVSDRALVKLVYQARDINEVFPALDLLHGAGRGHIVLAMGEAGLITRILAKKLGAHLTFASLDAARATAPGQLSLATFTSLYRAACIDADTEVFGLIGDPVGHSRSPAIHNACFAQQGMNRLYLPCWVTGGGEALHAFLDAVSARPWLDVRGFSVTIPHKEGALDYVRRAGGDVDRRTATIGAANTLLHGAPGRWSAANTDYSGALRALYGALGLSAGELRDWPVAVVGAGGVARALVAALVEAGTQVTIHNRTRSRAEALAAAFGCQAAGLEALATPKARLIVNCTSVGMVPRVEDSPVPPAGLEGVRAVFDTVYTPRDTRLLREARERGAATVDGVTMFVNQAVDQFRLFTGTDADAELMERVALATG